MLDPTSEAAENGAPGLKPKWTKPEVIVIASIADVSARTSIWPDEDFDGMPDRS